jgi:hypothetical protein
MTEITRYVAVNNKEFNNKHEAILEDLMVVKEIMEAVSGTMSVCADCPLKEICDEILKDAQTDLCSYF